MKELVSVIVPVYNAEKYLDDCIRSIYGQAYNNIEVILINDGSKDDSEKICLEWCKKDTRMKYFYQENRGVSEARNHGLRIANGDYIVFVDSDDMLAEYTLKYAVERMNGKEHGLIAWNTCKMYDNTLKKEKEFVTDNLSELEIWRAIVSSSNKSINLGRYFRACWGKLFRADIIKDNQISFPVDTYIGEDAVFLLKYFEYTSDFVFIDYYGYYYRCLNTSAVHRYKRDLLEQSRRQLMYIRASADVFKARGYDKKYIDETISVFIWNIFDNLVRNEKKAPKSELVNDASIWYKENVDFLKRKKCQNQKISKACKIHCFARICRMAGVHKFITLFYDSLRNN